MEPPAFVATIVPAYAGIGSRQTPPSVLTLMMRIAGRLEKRGFRLRSGGADGADSAFEDGVTDPARLEVFLPWPGFNGRHYPALVIPQQAFDLAKQFHPNWGYLKAPVRRLMARNVMQVLGANLDSPSLFVVCWTPDGCESHAERSSVTGGTGQAISIASEHGIPVFNLARPDALARIGSMACVLTEGRSS